MLNSKKGVSLITVLMFMLVATIAATATFKWLNSEGDSSAARMREQNAIKAASSGINNARSWMTMHANETGAIIKQFKESKHPVLLNDVISQNSGSDNFRVWLVGVNDAEATYKVKLLSEGVDGRYKHHESAILNVSGLYQVNIPQDEQPSAVSAPYKYTYFGGTTNTEGNTNPFAMLVNGNWYGNPNHISTDFIVTGEAHLTGNDISVGGTACIGGDFTGDNGTDVGAIYVHGATTKFVPRPSDKGGVGVAGDAYFEGPFTQHPGIGRSFRVGGNLTINDTLNTRQSDDGSSFRVEGNFCVEDNAFVDIGGAQKVAGESPNIKDVFYVAGDVWIPGHHQFYNESPSNANATASEKDFSTLYNFIQLGMKTSPKSQLYIKDGYRHSEYVTMRNSKKFTDNSGEYRPYVEVKAQTGMPGAAEMYYFYYVEPGVTDVEYVNLGARGWGYKVGNYVYADGNQYHYGSKPVTVLKKMSPYCKTGDNNRPECHVSPWFTSKGELKRDFTESNKPTCAESVKKYCYSVWKSQAGCDKSEFFVPDMIQTAYDQYSQKVSTCSGLDTWDEGIASKMTTCYASASEKDLYNGYLVVKPTKFTNKAPSGKLKGKFIVIVDKVLPEALMFPPTDGDDDFVFMHLKKDVVRDGGMQATQHTEGAVYNYFIYTEGNIGGGVPNDKYDKAKCDAYCWRTNGNYYDWNCQHVTHADVCLAGSGLEADFQLKDGAVLKGSLYAVAANCAKIPQMKLSHAEENEALMKSLSNSGIICAAGPTKCGGGGDDNGDGNDGDGGEDGGNGGGQGGKTVDVYHVAIAPQLNVSVESQYEAREAVPSDAETVGKSYIILPRIIYLTQDPEGTLADYFSLINLNGGELRKDAGKMVCRNKDGETISSTGAVRLANDALLTEGNYTCTYNPGNDAYETMTSYIVVKGSSSQTPYVNLGTSEVVLGRGSSTNVEAVVSASTAAEECTFSVSVSALPEGWTITTPGVSGELSGASGGRSYYSASITPTASNDVPKQLFHISATPNAASGKVYIMLDSPFENCLPGPRISEVVTIVGDANFVREGLSEYCKLAENKSVCDEKGYDEIEDRLDCDDLIQSKGETPVWVQAEGDGCRVQTTNKKWECKTSSKSVTLKAGTDIPSYCDVVVPTENNTIASPESDETYTLYGSIKRKAFNVTLKIDGAKDNDTKVIVKRNIFGSDSKFDDVECEASDAPCVIENVLAGTRLTLSVDGAGADKDMFKYWNCDGSDCIDDRQHFTNEEWEYPLITGNNTIIANFNKRDEHCFYEDFKNMFAFCENGQTQCIDTCRTKLDKNEVCGAKQSAQQNAEWLMMYNNNGGGAMTKPVIDDAGGGSYMSSDKNASNNAGRQSIVLSTVDAGPYGQMTAMMTTTILKKADGNDFLNSGMIFRAKMDGTANSEFLILNVFGVKSPSNASVGTLTARVCKIVGQSINNYGNGNCKYESLGTTISSTDMIKVGLVVDENDNLAVTMKVGAYVGTVNFDLSEYGTNDAEHKYVGMDLSEAALKLFDIGWQSSSFSEECWDVPTVICSFAANYLGGRVPQNEEVSPWVGASSWFTENNCVKAYYYNGNDNVTKYGIDQPGKLGTRLDDSLYKFTAGGPHGNIGADGKLHKDAKIKMSCPGVESSLELSPFEYSCGDFVVGMLENCKEDFNLVTTSVSGYGPEQKTENVVETGLKGVNLRGATLLLDVGYLSSGGMISVWLMSRSGELSLPAYISESGPVNVDVNVMSNAEGFNPQNVKGVVVAGAEGTSYTINSISSICPNSVTIHCGKPVFDKLTGNWKVSTTVSGHSLETKCSGSVDNSNWNGFAEMSCSGQKDWYFEYKGESVSDLLEQLNEFGLASVSFDIKASINGNETACTPAPVSDAISAMGEPTCDITPTSKEQEAGMPTFKFTLTSDNCPGGKCPYSITLNGVEVKTGEASSGQLQNFTENDKNTSTPLERGTYRYTVTSYGKSCFEEFEITNKKTPPSILDCSLDESTGKFTASLSNPDGAEFEYAIGVFNGGVEVLPASSASSTGTSVSYTGKPTGVGSYTYNVQVKYGTETPISCSSTLVIKDAAPSCTDKAVGDVTMEDGSATISVNNLVTQRCVGTDVSCEYAVSGQDVSGDVGSDGKATFNIYASSLGSKSYTVNITRNDHETGSCTVTANVVAPAPTASNCAVGETELKSGDSTTFSATLANVTSWSLKKNGTQVASGDAATSISQRIGGYGEYKLYLNGSSTAACSQTITKKEESGGMCTSGAIVKTYTCTPGGAGNTGNFDTAGAVCVKIKGSFGGWGFSNSDGRKWRINGGSFGTTSGESVDATSDGYVYIDITAGSFTWASVYWYNCK